MLCAKPKVFVTMAGNQGRLTDAHLLKQNHLPCAFDVSAAHTKILRHLLLECVDLLALYQCK